LASVPSLGSVASSSGVSSTGPPRYTIDQLALNMGFGGIRPAAVNPPNLSPTPTPISSSTSLVNTTNAFSNTLLTKSSSELKFEPVDSISLNTEFSNETDVETKERIITKIDPDDMTAKSTVVNVSKDPARRAAVLLAGPKFQLNYNEMPTDKLTINTDTIFPVAVSIIIIIKIYK
jgi:hypothetical protein